MQYAGDSNYIIFFHMENLLLYERHEDDEHESN